LDFVTSLRLPDRVGVIRVYRKGWFNTADLDLSDIVLRNLGQEVVSIKNPMIATRFIQSTWFEKKIDPGSLRWSPT
jgi:hypothetical protein